MVGVTGSWTNQSYPGDEYLPFEPSSSPLGHSKVAQRHRGGSLHRLVYSCTVFLGGQVNSTVSTAEQCTSEGGGKGKGGYCTQPTSAASALLPQAKNDFGLLCGLWP